MDYQAIPSKHVPSQKLHPTQLVTFLLALALIALCGCSILHQQPVPSVAPSAPTTDGQTPDAIPEEAEGSFVRPTPEPVDPSRFIGVWADGARNYLLVPEEGQAELYLSAFNALYILDQSFSTESWELQLGDEDHVFSALLSDRDDLLSLSGPGFDALQLDRSTPEQRDQIRHDTGCCFLGDWDMYTVTQIPIGTVASFRSDGTCSLYGAEFTWQPGAEGKEDRDAISIYLYGELYYILVGSETPMGDQAYLSRKDFSHWHSSAMLQRVGTELELPVVEDLGNG